MNGRYRNCRWIGRQSPIEAAGDGAIRDRAGGGFGGETLGLTPEQVQRKLIQGDHQRQRALGRRLPVGQLAGCRRPIGGQEARPQRFIKSRGSREPQRLDGLREPERDNFGGMGNAG